jgi:hypothetical protein
MEKDKRGKEQAVKFEVKIRRVNNPRWKADPLKAHNLKDVRQYLAETITKYGRLNPGSYQLSLKYKEGYGKDEDGRTWLINWEGTPQKAIEFFTEYVQKIEEELKEKLKENKQEV